MKRKNKNKIKGSISDQVMNITVYVFTVLVIIVTLYPLIYVVSMSISDPVQASRGEVFLWPKGFSILSYQKVLKDAEILRYYGNTIWYTVVGTLCGLFTTMLAAYPLTRKNFVGRKFFNLMLVITMFFGGGMIPTYIVVVKFLNLYNTRWAMILPSLTSVFNIYMVRNFIMSLPNDLFDSAKIDGAGEFHIFRSIVIPLCAPVVSVLTIFFGVGYWNSYFPALLYQGDKTLHPLGMYIREVVLKSSINTTGEFLGGAVSSAELLSSLQLKYTVIVVAVVPLLVLYPFFSKYMKKGMMVGAVKG